MTIQSKIWIPAVIGVISQQSFFNILRFGGNLHKGEFQCFEWMNVMNEWFESTKIGQKRQNYSHHMKILLNRE